MQQRILFTKNEYDDDGNISQEGVFLHIGPVRIFVGSAANVREIARSLIAIADEVEDPDKYFERVTLRRRMVDFVEHDLSGDEVTWLYNLLRNKGMPEVK